MRVLVHDGMRALQAQTTSNGPQVSYTRGTDLSGSMEGAGGIGGLLGRSHGYSAGNSSAHNFYHTDGNGNVTYLVNSSQTRSASYHYDPYGNALIASELLSYLEGWQRDNCVFVCETVFGGAKRLGHIGYTAGTGAIALHRGGSVQVCENVRANCLLDDLRKPDAPLFRIPLRPF